MHQLIQKQFLHQTYIYIYIINTNNVSICQCGVQIYPMISIRFQKGASVFFCLFFFFFFLGGGRSGHHGLLGGHCVSSSGLVRMLGASCVAWWRHQMETFSALLAICAGNSPASGEFPAQRPMTRSFDVFFDLCLNKRLRKQSCGWWFETLSRPLWRQCNGILGSMVSH